MTDNTGGIQPYVTNTAAAIVRRNSNTAWGSAVEKFNKPKPSPQYVIAYGTRPSMKEMLPLTMCVGWRRERLYSGNSWTTSSASRKARSSKASTWARPLVSQTCKERRMQHCKPTRSMATASANTSCGLWAEASLIMLQPQKLCSSSCPMASIRSSCAVH